MVMTRIDCRTHLLRREEAVLIYLFVEGETHPPKRYDPHFQLLSPPDAATRPKIEATADDLALNHRLFVPHLS